MSINRFLSKESPRLPALGLTSQKSTTEIKLKYKINLNIVPIELF